MRLSSLEPPLPVPEVPNTNHQPDVEAEVGNAEHVGFWFGKVILVWESDFGPLPVILPEGGGYTPRITGAEWRSLQRKHATGETPWAGLECGLLPEADPPVVLRGLGLADPPVAVFPLEEHRPPAERDLGERVVRADERE